MSDSIIQSVRPFVRTYAVRSEDLAKQGGQTETRPDTRIRRLMTERFPSRSDHVDINLCLTSYLYLKETNFQFITSCSFAGVDRLHTSNFRRPPIKQVLPVPSSQFSVSARGHWTIYLAPLELQHESCARLNFI